MKTKGVPIVLRKLKEQMKDTHYLKMYNCLIKEKEAKVLNYKKITCLFQGNETYKG